MRFSRLQILFLVCVIVLGFSIGVLIKGTPLVMPFFFLLFLAILGVAFIPGGGNVWVHIRNGVRTISPHVRNFGTMVIRNARSFGQSVWTGTRRGAAHVSPHLKSWISGLYDATSNTVRDCKDWVVAKVRQSPYFWCGMILAVIAFYVFGSAYLYKNWSRFHLGMILAYLSAMFFISHYDWWDDVSRFVAKHIVGIWLVASVASLALTYGHNWGTVSVVLSAVSAVCAIITIAKWWEPLRKGTGQAVGKVFEEILKPFTGHYGPGVALIAMSVVVFVVFCFLYLNGVILGAARADTARSLAVLFALLFLGGVGVVIWEIHQKIKVEKEK